MISHDHVKIENFLKMSNLSLRLATKIGKKFNNTLPQVKYIDLY